MQEKEWTVNDYWKDIFESELCYMNYMANETCEILTDRIHMVHKVKPASSTGRYHPYWAQGVNGLVKHTKTVFWLLNDLLIAREDSIDSRLKGHLLSAALLHDMMKYAYGDTHSRFDHPELMFNVVKEYDNMYYVATLIRCHMGRWNKDYRHSSVILPVPATEEQWLLHYADYMASRPTCTERYGL